MSVLVTIKPINNIEKFCIDNENVKLQTKVIVEDEILEKLQKFNITKKGLIPKETIIAIKPELEGTEFKEYNSDK